MNFSQNSWTFFRLELFEIREIYFVEIDELFSNSWFLSKFHALFSNLCLFFKTNVIFSKMWLFIYLKIDENIQIHVFFIKIDESFQIRELFSNPMIFSYLWTFFKLQSFLNPANFFWAHELFEFMNLFICGLFRTVIFFELVKHFLNYWFFFQIFTLVNCKRTNETYNAKKSSRANFDQGLDAQNPSSSHSLLSSHVAKTPQHHYTTVSREIAVGENRRKKKGNGNSPRVFGRLGRLCQVWLGGNFLSGH